MPTKRKEGMRVERDDECVEQGRGVKEEGRQDSPGQRE